MSRIYVSSTFSDLQDQREAVYRALRRLGHDVVAMEDYVASDQRPLDRCLDDVASSDVYIGIVAWRYGYVPPTGNPEAYSGPRKTIFRTRRVAIGDGPLSGRIGFAHSTYRKWTVERVLYHRVLSL